jgi:hypothetical protein
MNTLINATLNLFVGILRRSGLLSGGVKRTFNGRAYKLVFMSTRPSTTLADLLRPPLLANPFSTMRASLRR